MDISLDKPIINAPNPLLSDIQSSLGPKTFIVAIELLTSPMYAQSREYLAEILYERLGGELSEKQEAVDSVITLLAEQFLPSDDQSSNKDWKKLQKEQKKLEKKKAKEEKKTKQIEPSPFPISPPITPSIPQNSNSAKTILTEEQLLAFFKKFPRYALLSATEEKEANGGFPHSEKFFLKQILKKHNLQEVSAWIQPLEQIPEEELKAALANFHLNQYQEIDNIEKRAEKASKQVSPEHRKAFQEGILNRAFSLS
ncbi:MAG: hypothetical protein CMO81_02960 [Waddliaceae bacterium]|nr:hypothetical protein [Waddliaceae bacterium]